MAFSKAQLLDILADANEGQPEERQLSYASIVDAAYRAESSSSDEAEVVEKIRAFASAATTTHYKTRNAFVLSCSDLLPEGHALGSSDVERKVEWLLSDPLLDEARVPLVAAAINGYASETENSHAWVRLKLLADQGTLPKQFIDTVAALEREVLNG